MPCPTINYPVLTLGQGTFPDLYALLVLWEVSLKVINILYRRRIIPFLLLLISFPFCFGCAAQRESRTDDQPLIEDDYVFNAKSWQESYISIVKDWHCLEDQYGDILAHEFRRYAYDQSLISFDYYTLYDVNEDGTPELFLSSSGMKLTLVLTYKDSPELIGLVQIFGILPGNGEIILHKSSNYLMESAREQWMIYHLPVGADTLVAYFECERSAGERIRVIEGKTSAGRISDPSIDDFLEFYNRYIIPCVRFENLPQWKCSDQTGFEAWSNIRLENYMSYGQEKQNCMQDFERFITSGSFKTLGQEYATECPIQAALFDLDGDEIPEILLTNGLNDNRCSSYLYTYNSGLFSFVGVGPYNAYWSHNLLGRIINPSSTSWYEYIKTGFGTIRAVPVESESSEKLETGSYSEPIMRISWVDISDSDSKTWESIKANWDAFMK